MTTSIGDRFVRRQNAARSSTSNTTAADITYDTAVLAEGGYSWSSPSVTVDTAGKYLYIGDLGQANLASTRAVGTHVPAVNGTTQEPVGLASHRYLRNSAGAQQGASIGMGILSLSASDAVKVRNPGAILSVDAVGNYATNASYGGALQLIRLPDTGDYLHLERSADAAEVGISNINTTRPWLDSSGTWTKMTWPTEVADSGGWHTASSGDVTLPASKKFLIVWTASHYTTDASRNTFVTALNIAGTRVQTASGYQRNTSSQGPPHCGMYLHETGGSSETLYLEATQETEGGDAGTPKFADGALQIIELPASAEWVHADNGTTSNALATALASTSTWYTTPLLTGSTVRTDGNGNLTLDGPNDAISNDSGGSLPVLAIGWHRWDRDTGSSGNRKAPWSRWNNGGSAVGYGIAGAYSRGQQSNDDTFQAHYVAAATMDMASAALLTFEVNDPVNGNNSDMGIYTSTAGSRYFLGVQVLDLSSLTGGTGASIAATAVTLPFTVGTPTVTAGASATVAATAITLPFTVGTPTVTVGAKTEVVAVELSGTYDVSGSGGASVSATAITLPFTVGTPVVTSDASVAGTAIPLPFTVGTPSVVAGTGATAAATAIPLPFTVGTPTVTAGADVTATAVTFPFTVGTPTITTTANVTATAITWPFTVPQPSVATATVVTATSVPWTFTVGTPTVTAGTGATPSTASILWPWTVSTTTVTSDASIAAAAVPLLFTISSPAVAGGTGATVSPTAVALPFTISIPTVTTGADVAATAIVWPFTIPQPGIQAGANANINPTAVVWSWSIGSPSLSAGASITATAITLPFTVGSPSVTAGTGATTSAVAVVWLWTLGAATVTSAATVTPSAITWTFAIPQPTVITGGDANVNPTALPWTWTISVPSVSAGATVTPSALTWPFTVGAPSLTAGTGATTAATAVTWTWSIGSPTVTAQGDATITATAIPVPFTVGSPTVTAAAAPSAAAIGWSWTIGSPTVATAATELVAVELSGLYTTTAGNGNITTTAVAWSWTIPQPTIDVDANANITTIAVTWPWTVGTASVSTGVATELVAIELSGTYDVTGDNTITPAALNWSWTINDSLPSTSVTYYATALNWSWTINQPQIAVSGITPTAIVWPWTVNGPTVSSGGQLTNIPAGGILLNWFIPIPDVASGLSNLVGVTSNPTGKSATRGSNSGAATLSLFDEAATQGGTGDSSTSNTQGAAHTSQTRRPAGTGG